MHTPGTTSISNTTLVDFSEYIKKVCILFFRDANQTMIFCQRGLKIGASDQAKSYDEKSAIIALAKQEISITELLSALRIEITFDGTPEESRFREETLIELGKGYLEYENENDSEIIALLENMENQKITKDTTRNRYHKVISSVI